MPLTTVRFDRVFDVVKGQRGRKPVTFFGFQFGELKKYGIAAPGEPCLAEGSIVTAYLDEQDNWQSLRGWFNHTTGELAVESIGYEVFFLFWCSLVFPFMLLVAASQLWIALAIALVATLILVGCILSILRLQKIRRTLLHVKDDPLAFQKIRIDCDFS